MAKCVAEHRKHLYGLRARLFYISCRLVGGFLMKSEEGLDRHVTSWCLLMVQPTLGLLFRGEEHCICCRLGAGRLTLSTHFVPSDEYLA